MPFDRKKPLEFVSQFRQEVEDWMKDHGLICSNGSWSAPFTYITGQIIFEEHYWRGTINAD